MPPANGCPKAGPSYPEVTRAICRVPSTQFSQAPWYALPVHLCRFGVRSKAGAISWNAFAALAIHLSEDNFPHSSHPSRPTNINVVPIAYGFRPRLRGRLTLRGLALRRNPWIFGVRVSHPHLATHVSILTSDTSSKPHGSPSQAYGTLRYHLSKTSPQLRYTTLAPIHLRRRTACLDQ